MTSVATLPAPTPAPSADSAPDVAPEAAGLGLALGVDPTKPFPDDSLTITVTVHNTTRGELADLSVASKKLPDCARTGLGNLDAGESLTYTCKATADKKPGEHKVTATVTAIKDGHWSQDGYQGKKLRTNASATYHVQKDHSGTPTPSVTPSHLPVTGTDLAVVTTTGMSLLLVGVLLATLAGVIGSRRAKRR